MNPSVRNRTVILFAITALAFTLLETANAQNAPAESTVKTISASPTTAHPITPLTTTPVQNGQAQPSAQEIIEAAKAREDSLEYQSYKARIRRDIYKRWQPQKAYVNLPLLAFNVSDAGTVSNVTVVVPSDSKEFDASAVKAVETAGKFEVPPAPIGAPVLLDFAFEPWIPDSAIPYPEIPEEWLSTLGCALEFTGFGYSFYLLLVSFALVCIRKFSRAIQMAFASIFLAISSLAVPGIIYLIFEKIGVSRTNGWVLVQSLTVFGVIALLVGVLLPIVVAWTRGKRGKQLAWVVVVTLLGAAVPFLWPVGLFLACMGPRASRIANTEPASAAAV